MNAYYNAAAFSQPAADVIGTAPRNLSYRGPQMNMFDAALLKSFRTVEGQRFEFRIEGSNAFNHPVFADPSSSFGSSSFGQITGVKGESRRIQLGMKYYF